ncbi:DMT family transporter [Clostridium sp. MT-14]|uniref:DMT family transporter n=1 Tax=Clostridium aromativorans TaxID=2836848 RepID=A0ABS8N3E5_9CLOT|nr:MULTISPECIES: DMT family transporter [Clostridium]KAA8672032.1 DMT family transporter [Clostridium sp. HV4-5-A1G]MCC9294341.1 DMT family transporter [Clostridium aromativorans]
MGYIFIGLTAVIFSTMEITGKLIVGVNPLQLNFLRFLIGGLFLVPFALRSMKYKKIKLKKEDFLYFVMTGFLCVVVSMSFFQLAVTYTKASTVAIIFSTNPVFTIILAYFVLKEKMNRGTVISVVLSIVGMVFILNPFGINSDMKGISFAFLSAVSFSIYAVIGKLRSERYGCMVLNCMTFLTGDIIMFFLMLISKMPVIINFIGTNENLRFMADIPIFYGISSVNIIPVMFLGIVVTGMGYMFYFLAMDKTSASMASMVFFIKPVLAPIFALIVLEETILANTTIGICFILIGSYFSVGWRGKSVLAKD